MPATSKVLRVTQGQVEAITPQQMVEAAARELGFRKRVYQRRVDLGQMAESKALHEIAAMQAIHDLLDRHAQGRLF